MEDYDSVKVDEIRDEREFYQAIKEYSSKVWQWGATYDDDFDGEMTPDELVEVLEQRVQWVKAHKKAVERYLQKQSGSRWLRVIDGSVTGPQDPSGE